MERKSVQISSGSLESKNNFTVSIHCGPRRRIEDAENIVFYDDEELSVVGSNVRKGGEP